MKNILVAMLLTSPLVSMASLAAEQPYDACVGQFTSTETKATYEDFDFWIGEWQVVATETGELRGYDKIKMIHNGCVLQQEWHQMDDVFSNPNAPVRLRGTSLTGIDAQGRWRQLWTDNFGSNILLTGGLDNDGTMTLTSEWTEVPTQTGARVKIRNIWHWALQDDGSIHNWGERQRGSETGPKTKYYDITYHRSVIGGRVFGFRNPNPEEQN